MTNHFGPLADEFAGAKFGDERLTNRLGIIASRVERAPGASFPRMCATGAELEAFYRFLGNDSVSVESILAPHIEATIDRCGGFAEVLVLHDSSELSFSSPRERVGRLQACRSGFLGHFSLAVGLSAGCTGHAPLGLLAFSTIHRMAPPKKLSRNEHRKKTTRESDRWLQGVEESECLLSHQALQPIHVADREADFYGLLSPLVEQGMRFVIRLRIDRNCLDGHGELSRVRALLEAQDSVLLREVAVSKRLPWKGSKTANTHHKPRDARQATLHVRAAPIEIVRPAHDRTSQQPTLRMNAVHVFEPTPPGEETPIEWILLTSEPIDSVDQQILVVDVYRARWLIEEYFKALKTGCAYEDRQLESRATLVNALAILLPAAWQLLALRTLARTDATAPATALLTDAQVNVLQRISLRVKLGQNPTIREAMLAIAGLGGHIKNNGEPGWIVIHRGMEDLTRACIGWSAAREEM